MAKVLCSGRGYHGRMGHLPCSRRGTVQRNGKWFCFQHDPEYIEKKREAWRKKFNAKQAEGERIQKRAKQLARQLGVKGDADYSWRGSAYVEFLVISFEDAEKLIARKNQWMT